MQKKDFEEILTIMAGLPVTIRLLDPPLHEFLPHSEHEMLEVAKAAGTDLAKVKIRAQQLHEANPMLGHRGCRLGITYPEIYEMQARAIFDAACAVQKAGHVVLPEVMIPLVLSKKEFSILKDVIDAEATKAMTRAGVKIAYLVGTMIELPRAALMAGHIAESAEFFSFGTNDLTQTTMGISRDDAGTFLPDYARMGILERDPFASLDQSGVGELVRIAVERGRATRNNIKLGVCGEHGGDPRSIHVFHELGLDYVSCSPFRVPVARLEAGRALVLNLASGSPV
jgi:pyruvate,orthophosphate dikinase